MTEFSEVAQPRSKLAKLISRIFPRWALSYTWAEMEKVYPMIEHYGYLIVFGVVLGTAGIPFPSAAMLLASGVLVQQGHLNLTYAILFGVLGAIVGNQIGYWVGHKADRPFLLKWGATRPHPRAPGSGRTVLRTPRG